MNATDLNAVLSYYNQSLPSSINVSSYTLDASAIQALSDVGITVVPEPATTSLLAVGGLSLLTYAWRRRRSSTVAPTVNRTGVNPSFPPPMSRR